MTKQLRTLSLLIMAMVAVFLPIACTDEETGLGIDLEDPATLFAGQRDTIFADWAYSLRDDSLRTSNYNYGIIGNYHDDIFGSVQATLFTQIALPSASTRINFDPSSGTHTIDSVVLTMVIDELFPDSLATYDFHFEIRQLASPLLADTTYYSTDFIEVATDVPPLFDGTVKVKASDSLIHLRLNPVINQVIGVNATAEEFAELTKGMRIRLTNAGDDGMLTVQLNASQTCMTAYFHYSGTDSITTQTFEVGKETAHFSQFVHDYTGTRFASQADSIDGSEKIYLEPLGGFNARISFDSAIRQFHTQHPNAVIHYAELLLATDFETAATGPFPDRIMAFKPTSDGGDVYINDIVDPQYFAGFDGSFNKEKEAFRLRITQHLQEMLRKGTDPGTLLVLNGRRSSAARLVIRGPEAGNVPRIIFVYSE